MQYKAFTFSCTKIFLGINFPESDQKLQKLQKILSANFNALKVTCKLEFCQNIENLIGQVNKKIIIQLRHIYQVELSRAQNGVRTKDLEKISEIRYAATNRNQPGRSIE